MDVTDPVIQGFGENTVHKFDDGGIRCHKIIFAVVHICGLHFHFFGCFGNKRPEILYTGDRLFLCILFKMN